MTFAPYFDLASAEYAHMTSGVIDGNADNTICAWVRWTSDAAANGLWKVSTGSTTSWNNGDNLIVRGTGFVPANTIRIQSFSSGVGTSSDYTPSPSLAGSWVHVASRRSGNNFTLFYNGVEVATLVNDVTGRGATTYLSFARAENTNYYEGALVGAMAFDYALTDAEILRQSKQLTPAMPAWGYWPWLETDESGNGRDLTVVGTVTREPSSTATMPPAKWRNGRTAQAIVNDAVAGSATMAADVGAFATTFQDAALLRQRKLTADVGAFATTFMPATLTDSQGPPPSTGGQQRLAIGLRIGI